MCTCFLGKNTACMVCLLSTPTGGQVFYSIDVLFATLYELVSKTMGVPLMRIFSTVELLYSGHFYWDQNEFSSLLGARRKGVTKIASEIRQSTGKMAFRNTTGSLFIKLPKLKKIIITPGLFTHDKIFQFNYFESKKILLGHALHHSQFT